MNDSQYEILTHWYAYTYDRQEDASPIVQWILRGLGDIPQHVFEAGCGTGLLSTPLADIGHSVTAIDIDESMLNFALVRAKSRANLCVHKADMLTTPWGGGYDAVILGANLLLNIVTDWDYKQAQKQLIDRAARALKPAGKLFLDFDCPDRLSERYGRPGEQLCFEGTDDRGTHGRYIVINVTADDRTRIVKSSARYEIIPLSGRQFTYACSRTKHFPTLEQVCGWLYRSGLTIEQLHGSHDGQPFDSAHRRAVIQALKPL